MSEKTAVEKFTAPVILHPTVTHSIETIRRVEQESGRKAVVINGMPTLVSINCKLNEV